MKRFQSVHASPSDRELFYLNIAAQKAASAGNSTRIELYRLLGVSLETIVQTLGASQNYEYAKYLIAQNPQQTSLTRLLIAGAKIAKNHVFVEHLCPGSEHQEDNETPVFLSPRIPTAKNPHTLFSRSKTGDLSLFDNEQHALHQAACEVMKNYKSANTTTQRCRIETRYKFYRALGISMNQLHDKNPLDRPSLQNPLSAR